MDNGNFFSEVQLLIRKGACTDRVFAGTDIFTLFTGNNVLLKKVTSPGIWHFRRFISRQASIPVPQPLS
jgi:hypothetical protein